MARVITLTTDFGVQDWYVAAMKGVILGLNPSAQIVDLTHGVPPGDIRAGAFALAAVYHYFPRRTIHTVVVDPGVGSPRAALLVRTRHYDFVGPDNGVLALALARELVQAIHRLENSNYLPRPISQTFHGRDVFAPAAGYLSIGVSPNKLGRKLTQYKELAWPKPERRGKVIRGEVIYIDHFGNALTNLALADWPEIRQRPVAVRIKGRRRCPLVHFYQEVPSGQPLALWGSSGLLEVSVHGGSAAHALGLRRGSRVEVWACGSPPRP